MTPIFDLNLLLTGTYHDWLLAGLLTSLSLTGISLALALPLAIIIALVRLSPVKLLQWSGFAFVEAIRNVPLLAHMLFWYFGAPELLPTAAREWLYARNVEAHQRHHCLDALHRRPTCRRMCAAASARFPASSSRRRARSVSASSPACDWWCCRRPCASRFRR
jgi:His/Glu/Gln/Arg/opine family amino acid ABC transporter permease subunit